MSPFVKVIRFLSVFLTWFSVSETCQADVGQALVNVGSGRIERMSMLTSKYVSARHVDVWLPDSYPKAGRYAVLYMFDGQMLFDSRDTWNRQEWRADETAGRLIAKGQVKPFIIVGIWNAGDARHAEYFPQKAFAMLTAKQQAAQFKLKLHDKPLYSKPIYSDALLRFLTSELKPAIDRKYLTKPDSANTAVAGASMGGLMSWYAMSEYPKVFGSAGCISSHWPGGMPDPDAPGPAVFLKYLKANLPKAGQHRIWFDRGTLTLDANYGATQLQVDQLMRQKGYTDKDWKSTVFDGKDHSELAWAERFDQVLLFLMKK